MKGGVGAVAANVATAKPLIFPFCFRATAAAYIASALHFLDSKNDIAGLIPPKKFPIINELNMFY